MPGNVFKGAPTSCSVGPSVQLDESLNLFLSVAGLSNLQNKTCRCCVCYHHQCESQHQEGNRIQQLAIFLTFMETWPLQKASYDVQYCIDVKLSEVCNHIMGTYDNVPVLWKYNTELLRTKG